MVSNNPYYTHDSYTNHQSPRIAGGGAHRRPDDTTTNLSLNKPGDLKSPPNQGGGGGVLSAWAPEILWSGISIATLIALFLTLRSFDGRSIDPEHWPISPNVTLNTLVAFLTAICQLSLLIPITQGLAQLKWNWFARAAPGGIPRRERPLGDFCLFDDAAFGTGRWGGWPLGALRLLFSGRGRTLGVSACLVLLTGWLSGPSTQGAIGYRMGEVPVEPGSGDFATVARGETYFLTSSSPSSQGGVVKQEKLTSGKSGTYL